MNVVKRVQKYTRKGMGNRIKRARDIQVNRQLARITDQRFRGILALRAGSKMGY